MENEEFSPEKVTAAKEMDAAEAAMTRVEQRIEALEKENAQLKRDLDDLQVHFDTTALNDSICLSMLRKEHEELRLALALRTQQCADIGAPIDPMENWLMQPALEWLEQAEHLHDNERCKTIAALLRDLWRQLPREGNTVAPTKATCI